MNADTFAPYLKQLSLLYQLPYEELKSLCMQYPYFQNLHLLLLLKSKLEQHHDYPQNLARAAAYSVDRAQLYRSLNQLEVVVQADNFQLQEDYLELQDIGDWQAQLESLELLALQEEALSDTEQLPEISFEPSNEPIPAKSTAVIPPALPEVTAGRQSIPDLRQIVANCAAVAMCIQQTQPRLLRPVNRPVIRSTTSSSTAADKVPKPTPKQSFSTWVEQFQPAHVKPHLGALMEARQRKKKQSEPTQIDSENLHIFAARSIQENPDTVSETLAKILEDQHKYEEAIKVYKRLSLIFPEKNTLFAEKVKNLKKLIS